VSDSRAAAGNGSVLAPLIKGRFRVVGAPSERPEVTVYPAEDLTTGAAVTIEVLRGQFAADRAFVAAVRDQAYRLSKPDCAHRAILRVHESGATDDGEIYVVLERVAGRSLRQVLAERGAFDEPAALALVIQVGEALEVLHHSGIVHGELRPEVVVLLAEGESVKLLGAELGSARRTPIGQGARDETLAAYLAPEQRAGGPVSEATDVHGLGLLLHELLTDERPTPGRTPSRRGLAGGVRRILDRALAERPDERYSSMSVLLNDLWSAQSSLPQAATDRLGVRRSRGINGPEPRVGLIIMALAGLTSLAVGAYIGLSGTLTAPSRTPVSTPPPASAPVAAPAPPSPAAVPATPRETASPLPPEPLPQKPPVAPPLAVEKPVAPPAARHEPPSVPERPPTPRAATTERAERPPAPRKPAAPAVSERKPEPGPPSASEPVQQPGSTADGSAIIDWLFKDRRAD
jgi:serine/threonine-protein kinase